ncbi:hypothetical protein R1sor_008717 [Riccia sorocarpa]|uniref:Non-haem dioxygenase N-terminal domain-containing protein n=1 Tax=Riccia sorocarpa TaxID=122646 RepID=A0ABD3HYC3_9MARC
MSELSSSDEEVPLQCGVECQPRTYNQCNYLYKGENHYPVPVVDLKGRLHDNDPEIRPALLRELVEAGRVGVICVVNHGIEEKLHSELKRAANTFFSLPFEEKFKCSKIPVPGHARSVGYQGQFQDLTQKAFVVQRREVFEIQGTPFTQNRDLLPWPESVPSFRGCVEAYAEEIRGLTKWMCEALAEGLGLEKDAFLKQIGSSDDLFHQQVVVCSQTYSGGINIFIGDPMECMSDGKFHAMIHRVRTPADRNRFSCVSPLEPINRASTIQPVPELVERSGIPAKYVPFSFLDRAASFMDQRFNPEIMTKRFMVKDASVLDPERDFSYKDGVFYVGTRPQGSVTEGY